MCENLFYIEIDFNIKKVLTHQRDNHAGCDASSVRHLGPQCEFGHSQCIQQMLYSESSNQMMLHFVVFWLIQEGETSHR